MNKIYRDPIHGDIELDDLAVKIIDTPEFQRLDGLKQLGWTDLVYRGAKHTRFQHSIGAYWMAKKIMEELYQNHLRFGQAEQFPVQEFSNIYGDKEKPEKILINVQKIISWAALLHDITHVPFGHTLEDENKNLIPWKHDSLYCPRLWLFLYDNNSAISEIFNTEKRYIDILDNSRLRDLLFLIIKFKRTITNDGVIGFRDHIKDAMKELENKRITRVAGLSGTEEYINYGCHETLTKLATLYEQMTITPLNNDKPLFHPFMNDMISDTICADSLDYLQRDLYFCGIRLSFDPRIYRYFILKKGHKTKQLRLVLKIKDPKKQNRIDIINEILNIMRLRYTLTERVLYHKIKMSASCMMKQAIKNKKGLIERDFSIKKNNLLLMTDTDLLMHLSRNDAISNNLIEMIQKKNLYKPCLIISFQYAQKIGLYGRLVRDYYLHDDAEKNVLTLEEQLTNEIKSIGHNVFISCSNPKMQAKEIDTYIQLEDDRIVAMKLQRQIDPIYREINALTEKYKNLWRFYIFLHPDDIKNEIIRHKVIDKFCDILGMQPDEAYKIALYDSNEPQGLVISILNEWKRDHAPPWITDLHYYQLKEIINNGNEWAKKINPRNPLLTKSNYFEQFEEIIIRNEITSFKTEYLNENKQVDENNIDTYCENQISGFLENPKKYSQKLMGKTRPKPNNYDLFKAEFEKLLK